MSNVDQEIIKIFPTLWLYLLRGRMKELDILQKNITNIISNISLKEASFLHDILCKITKLWLNVLFCANNSSNQKYSSLQCNKFYNKIIFCTKQYFNLWMSSLNFKIIDENNCINYFDKITLLPFLISKSHLILQFLIRCKC